MSDSLSFSRSSTSSQVVSTTSLSSSSVLDSSPTPNSSSPQFSTSDGAQIPLYLYTVTLTIAVFLFVAVVIAIRSCLRRREQQRMVEGIRNGTQVPPTRTNKPDTRRKPGMFEIWFLKDDGGDSGDGVGQGGSGKGRGHSVIHPKEQQEWNDIVPFSASYIHPATPTSYLFPSKTTPSRNAIFDSISYPWQNPLPLPSSTTLPSGIPDLHPNPSNPDLAQAVTVRVALLIAMPSQAHKQDGDEEEQVLPHIEFGVVEVELVPTSHEHEGQRKVS